MHATLKSYPSGLATWWRNQESRHVNKDELICLLVCSGSQFCGQRRFSVALSSANQHSTPSNGQEKARNTSHAHKYCVLISFIVEYLFYPWLKKRKKRKRKKRRKWLSYVMIYDDYYARYISYMWCNFLWMLRYPINIK